MSLLTACQAAVKESGVGAVPATIISNTDATAVQLNALAERSVKHLARMDWQRMLREHSITTVASTEDYALPTDWSRYMMQTAWDATSYWQMRGSISGSLWQAEKRGLAVNSGIRKDFRVWQNRVYITPTPTAVSTLVIEYIRNTPWVAVDGVTYRAAATVDTDAVIFPEFLLELDLLWRWRRAKGLSYDEEKLEAETEAMRTFGQETPAPTLDFGQNSEDTPEFVANLPSTV